MAHGSFNSDGRWRNQRDSVGCPGAARVNLIEDKANGSAVIQMLSNEIPALCSQFRLAKQSVISNCVSNRNVVSWSYETSTGHDIRCHFCVGFPARNSAV